MTVERFQKRGYTRHSGCARQKEQRQGNRRGHPFITLPAPSARMSPVFAQSSFPTRVPPFPAVHSIAASETAPLPNNAFVVSDVSQTH